MKIYTGDTGGQKFNILKELGLGVMISSTPGSLPHKEIKETFCALDNGAFSCYRKGYPFMEDVFLRTLSDAYKKNIPLDFIVCPDIVAGGKDSLSLSLTWANNQLRTAPRLALVVQDGLNPKDIGHYNLKRFTHLFVGGTKGWKWKTAKQWVDYGHDNGKKVHIGQCGRLEYLLTAYQYGADSCDSTSFTVNNSWHIIEEFYEIIGKKTTLLFEVA